MKQDYKKRFVSVLELSQMLSVSTLTIRRAIKEGKIKALRLNVKGNYRIPQEEIDRLCL